MTEKRMKPSCPEERVFPGVALRSLCEPEAATFRYLLRKGEGITTAAAAPAPLAPGVPRAAPPLEGAAPSLKMAPPVSPTGSDVRALLLKMAAVYLRPPRNLPLSNMAVVPQVLPPAAASVCPQ